MSKKTVTIPLAVARNIQEALQLAVSRAMDRADMDASNVPPGSRNYIDWLDADRQAVARITDAAEELDEVIKRSSLPVGPLTGMPVESVRNVVRAGTIKSCDMHPRLSHENPQMVYARVTADILLPEKQFNKIMAEGAKK